MKLAPIVVMGLLGLCSCNEQHSNRKHKHSSQINYSPQPITVDKSPMEVVKSNRKSYSYEQTINGNFGDIIPLYCPVRELDWCENWGPKAVYSHSAMVDKDCVFVTSHRTTNVV